MATPTTRTTPVETSTADKFDRIWAAMSEADRQVILGHSRPLLTPEDKVRLARVARALRQTMQAKSESTAQFRAQTKVQSKAQAGAGRIRVDRLRRQIGTTR